MIGILDQIEVSSENFPALQQLVSDTYLPAAIARGMTLDHSWISPPVLIADGVNTLWLSWKVPDIGGWWNMRHSAGFDPSVALFWAAVNELCVRRERHYLSDSEPLQHHSLPRASTGIAPCVTTLNGTRETAQLTLRKSCDTNLVEQWKRAELAAPQHIPGLRQVFLAPNLDGSYRAGDYTYDAHFTDDTAQHKFPHNAYLREILQPLRDQVFAERCEMQVHLIGGGLGVPNMTNGIKRTAYFHLRSGTPATLATQFERDLLAMPNYIAGIKNWSLSRALHNQWTYVWEQEYEQLNDLLGEYMLHPFHWSYVDTWFDPEFSRQIVSSNLCHAFCPFERSVLAIGFES